jgi:hypothetical protein
MRVSSNTLLVALAVTGCSIYDEASDGFAGSTSAQAGSAGARDGTSSGGFSGTGGSAAKDGSSGGAPDADASGVAGGGGASGTGGNSGTSGGGGASGTAGASGIGGAAGGGAADAAGTSGAGGAAGGGGGGTSGAAGGSADGSSGADRSPGIDGDSSPCVTGTGPASLPFAVDQFFVSSGWMQPALIRQEASCVYPGDAGSAADSGGDAIADATLDRDGFSPGDGSTVPPLPGSKCWTITYTPVSATDWAGVDWQYPIDNWGQSPGLVIPPGAARVSLVAWGDVGTERVTFQVGYGPSSPDGFVASLTHQMLTTVPTRYAIDLRGIAYTCNSVRMGFGWLAEGAVSMTFHIADIRWE